MSMLLHRLRVCLITQPRWRAAIIVALVSPFIVAMAWAVVGLVLLVFLTKS